MSPTAPRVALVTGASRGIGQASAVALAAEGWDVLCHFHEHRAGAEATAAEVRKHGRRAVVAPADVGDAASCEALVRRAEQDLGPLEGIVANAGIYERRKVAALTVADWERTLRTNLTGAFLTVRPALPGMVQRRRGSIVFVSSILGTTGSQHGAHYAASKAGLVGLTRSLARELAPQGVRVNCVAPGAVDTDILKDDTPEQRARREGTIPLGRVGAPEEVAQAIAWLLGDRSAYVTGQVLHVNGGLLMS